MKISSAIYRIIQSSAFIGLTIFAGCKLAKNVGSNLQAESYPIDPQTSDAYDRDLASIDKNAELDISVIGVDEDLSYPTSHDVMGRQASQTVRIKLEEGVKGTLAEKFMRTELDNILPADSVKPLVRDLTNGAYPTRYSYNEKARTSQPHPQDVASYQDLEAKYRAAIAQSGPARTDFDRAFTELSDREKFKVITGLMAERSAYQQLSTASTKSLDAAIATGNEFSAIRAETDRLRTEAFRRDYLLSTPTLKDFFSKKGNTFRSVPYVRHP